ncbi:hypothetical protein [Bowmanella yangjiangensis]|uniref:Uncharacterized protein n=1 Tax=Bowmanella yangjiangensis TaxID=2811230 RepID=A0ABS3CMZ8_9ALTE|nr:hypothetical protein [Bowmanella yangjiangensis]MBN7818488.1 hypothetical protein [Bowmanella yangjiangensis]
MTKPTIALLLVTITANPDLGLQGRHMAFLMSCAEFALDVSEDDKERFRTLGFAVNERVKNHWPDNQDFIDGMLSAYEEFSELEPMSANIRDNKQLMSIKLTPDFCVLHARGAEAFLENTMSAKSSSRIPALVVEPIVVDGIRYEQVKNGLMAGFEQMGGLLAAFEQDQRLWVIKVYENQRDPAREGDVQDVFFKSMTLEADGLHLRIENERGRVFRVNRETRQVTEL